MHARVAIIDFPASVPATLTPSLMQISKNLHTSQFASKVLADLLTDWTIIDLVTDAQLQMWFEVSQLTRMTINDLCGEFDGHEDYDMVEFLSQMHSMALNSYCYLATRVPNLHLCSVLSYIEEQTTLLT